jgi:hypothetical protein
MPWGRGMKKEKRKGRKGKQSQDESKMEENIKIYAPKEKLKQKVQKSISWGGGF